VHFADADFPRFIGYPVQEGRSWSRGFQLRSHGSSGRASGLARAVMILGHVLAVLYSLVSFPLDREEAGAPVWGFSNPASLASR